ncbi:uncharacterized protein CELE_F52A8.3 [Caenorhabditis elegans]|uniref:Secreted protein n=1 Tax=Caenorhabditis elegans TaxID=6239 RepID=Q6A4I6_CAEEL|nr:Secreted protein [Caenorhabditis elegans]CAH10797.2 Secreted protein [Caenorhabditis elegans]|eukprot:NP_001335509.1 Uncharacterized protein CELE_F52A8.3 [Caenorhabditis elegans]
MWRFNSSSSIKSIMLLLTVFIMMANCEQSEEVLTRSKRSYYGGYDMYGDDFWYAGRIIGIIVGICLLLFCCCLPCVCIAGIWFAGWFGLRGKNQRKNTQQVSSPIIAQSAPVPIPVNYDNIPGNANYIQHTRQAPRQIHVDSSPRDSEISRVMVPGDQVMFSAEDRYYTSSTAPATAHRPDAYNVSRY